VGSPVSKIITGEGESAGATPPSSTRTGRPERSAPTPHVRAVRADEDLLVLLEPGIQRGPLEPGGAGEPSTGVPVRSRAAWAG